MNESPSRSPSPSPTLVPAWLAWPWRRPGTTLLVAFLVSIVALFGARGLELKTGFDELLPEGSPGVLASREAARRLPALTQVYVVVEGEPADVRPLVKQLAQGLRTLGTPWVESAESDLGPVRDFLGPRALYSLSTPELEKLRDDLVRRRDAAVAKATGADLEDATDAPKDDPVDMGALERRANEALGPSDGRFETDDGRVAVVRILTSIPNGELAKQAEALQRISARVAELAPSPRARIGYAGDLVTSLREYDQVRADLAQVGLMGVGLVLLVVFLHFGHARTLVALAVTIGIGLAWTFGIARVGVGYLNVATGFLVSIVAGNGINAGIVWQGRFLEERRRDVPAPEAAAIAQARTWRATLGATLAAAAAYASLAVTDLRAFRQFAFVGAFGMLACWVATYTALPAVVTLIERLRPLPIARAGAKRWWSDGIAFERPMLWLAARAPFAVAAVGIVAALAGAAATTGWAAADPLEYNMKKLGNDTSSGVEQERLSRLAARALGAGREGAQAVLCDRVDQVAPAAKALNAYRDAAPADAKPFSAVRSLGDLVPEDDPAHTALAREVHKLVRSARSRHAIDDATWAKIARYWSPDPPAPWKAADLPVDARRAFTERDGTEGRILYVEQTAGASDSDAHYLLRFADGIRRVPLPDGSACRGAGRALVFAELLAAVGRDGPRSVVASLLATIVAALVLLGSAGGALSVLGSLAVGLAWFGGALALAHVKLHFLNFVALPITFGVGADYAINIVTRQRESRSLDAALGATAGAVVLCSLTTIVGYLALLGSVNRAVRGLGQVAVLGEIACVAAAVMFVPALAKARARRTDERR